MQFNVEFFFVTIMNVELKISVLLSYQHVKTVMQNLCRISRKKIGSSLRPQTVIRQTSDLVTK